MKEHCTRSRTAINSEGRKRDKCKVREHHHHDVPSEGPFVVCRSVGRGSLHPTPAPTNLTKAPNAFALSCDLLAPHHLRDQLHWMKREPSWHRKSFWDSDSQHIMIQVGTHLLAKQPRTTEAVPWSRKEHTEFHVTANSTKFWHDQNRSTAWSAVKLIWGVRAK